MKKLKMHSPNLTQANIARLRELFPGCVTEGKVKGENGQVNYVIDKELAGFAPLRVVFRDNDFVSDAVKINVEQIFKQRSPGTEVKAI